MSRIRLRTAALAALLAALLPGCDSATEVSGDPRHGEVRFHHAGHQDGVFHAAGAPPDTTAVERDVTFGWEAGSGYQIAAYDQRGRWNGDTFQMFVQGSLEPGTYSSSQCANGESARCLSWMVLLLDGYHGSHDAPQGVTYSLRRGTVTLESVDAGRLRGVFSATLETAGGDSLTVTGGRFDVLRTL